MVKKKPKRPVQRRASVPPAKSPRRAGKPSSPGKHRLSSPAPVDKQLALLEAADLIRLAQAQPELAYLFRHALVQEAAYVSLLRNNRRLLHQTTGEVLEQLYPDRLDELAPVLGNHFDEGEDFERASRYFIRAGDLAIQRFGNAEAAMHYRRALAIARARTAVGKPGTSGRAPELLDLLVKLGRALELTGRYDDALAHYEEMQTYAHAQADRPLELAALVGRTTIHSAPTVRFDPSRAQTLTADAIALARELADERSEARLLWGASLVQKFLGQWAEHVRLGEQAAQIARRLHDRDLLAYVLNDIGEGLATIGQTERAIAALGEAHALWRALDNVPMITDNRSNLAYVHFITGRFASAEVLAQEAYQLSRRTHNLWGIVYSAMLLGFVYRETGDAAAAMTALEEALRLAVQSGFGLALCFAPSMLALTLTDMGDASSAIHHVREANDNITTAFAYARAFLTAAQLQAFITLGEIQKAEALVAEAEAYLFTDEFFSRAQVVWALASLELAKGAPTRALALTDDALATLSAARVTVSVPWLLFQKARALLALGRPQAARAVLEEARALAEPGRQRPILWLLLTELAALAAERGDTVAAAELRSQARAVVEFIAAHAPSAELRASFLARADVRALREAVEVVS